MRSFTVVFILAICAPVVLCQDDFYSYMFWTLPSKSVSKSTSNDKEKPDQEESIEDLGEFLPSDLEYDMEQVEFVPIIADSYPADSEIATADKRAEDDFIESEFWRQFIWILSHFDESEVDNNQTNTNQQDEYEMSKNKHKKYNPADMKKSSKMEKEKKSFEYVKNIDFENSRSIAVKSESQQMTETVSPWNPSEELKENSEKTTSEHSEESRHDEKYDGSEIEKDASSKDTPNFFYDLDESDNTRFVPLAPYPPDYSTTPFDVDYDIESSEMPDEKEEVSCEDYEDDSEENNPQVDQENSPENEQEDSTEDNSEYIQHDSEEDSLPRQTDSTKEEIIQSSGSDEKMTSAESKKEEPAMPEEIANPDSRKEEPAISEPFTYESFNDQFADEDKKNIQKIAPSSATKSANEEIVENISEIADNIESEHTQTEIEDIESTKQAKPESTNIEENEIKNAARDNNGLEYISFRKIMKSFFNHLLN